MVQFRRIPFGVTNGVFCLQRTVDKIINCEELKDIFAYVESIAVCEKAQQHDTNSIKFRKAAKMYNLTINEDKTIESTSGVLYICCFIEKGEKIPDPDRL